MKTTRISGLVCVVLAMFVLPATAQKAGRTTPANARMCDVMAGATPGLYGLCVAMCEAQRCEAEINPFTGKVDFDPNCSPSSEKLLENYYRLARPSDPQMPCVKTSCPCWTEAEIEKIGGSKDGGPSSDLCLLGESFSGIFNGAEWAYVLDDQVRGLTCQMMESNNSAPRERSISADAFTVCRESVFDECRSRGLAD